MLFEKRNRQNAISSQVTIPKSNPHHKHISVWILLHGPIVCFYTFDGANITKIIIFSAALYLKTALSILTPTTIRPAKTYCPGEQIYNNDFMT